MAYFLGYKEKDQYVPINLESSDILDIINYTTKFDNQFDLICDLVGDDLLDTDKELCYLISDGRKIKTNDGSLKYNLYKCLPYDRIFVSKDSSNFNISGISNFIINNKKNKDFINSLYADLIRRKVGLTQYTNAFYLECFKSYKKRNEIVDFLNDIYKLKISDNLKEILKEFGKVFSNNKTDQYYLSSPEYSCEINKIVQNIIRSDNDTVVIFEYLKNKIENYKIPTIKLLSEYYNTRTSQSLNMFINSLIYVRDNDTKEYKIEDDHLKINRRGIADIGSFITSYRDYTIEQINNEINNYELNKVEYKVPDDYEKEEFLTEEDYELLEKNNKLKHL